jgi:hypothetical protein
VNTASSRPYGPAFPRRGVFACDPKNPPLPPLDADAVEICDHTGRVIAFVWVVGEHVDTALRELQHEYLDQKDPIDGEGVSGPRLLK